jgi:hypothetical protein
MLTAHGAGAIMASRLDSQRGSALSGEVSRSKSTTHRAAIEAGTDRAKNSQAGSGPESSD